MMKYFFLIFVLSLIIIPAYADIENPKAVTDINVRIVQSGSLQINGKINYANLTIYIPQDTESVDITGADWSYIYDDFENRIVMLEWDNPSGNIEYKITSTVSNKAKYLSTEERIGNNDFYLQETESIEFSPAVRELAYPYEKTLSNVAYLADRFAVADSDEIPWLRVAR